MNAFDKSLEKIFQNYYERKHGKTINSPKQQTCCRMLNAYSKLSHKCLDCHLMMLKTLMI
jgi:hypothetical protein